MVELAMQTFELSKLIRKWRGKRLQKEAADALGISVRTYQNWEEGVSVPSKWCCKCLTKRIASGD